jgi:hypothetical protein
MTALTIRERLGEAVRFFAKLDAALFTTFSFNPDFFEQNVLPTVLGVEAPNPAAARPAVHARLCEVPVTVFYDRRFRYSRAAFSGIQVVQLRLRALFFIPRTSFSPA